MRYDVKSREDGSFYISIKGRPEKVRAEGNSIAILVQNLGIAMSQGKVIGFDISPGMAEDDPIKRAQTGALSSAEREEFFKHYNDLRSGC